MLQTKFRTVYRLSVLIAILAAVASAGGLFTSVYRDNAWVRPQLLGNDLVTLVVAVPLLVAGMVYARRGSQRGLLVWLGMLGYMLYNYAFYLFGAVFNEFFLLYVVLFALSLYALVFSVPRIDVNAIRQQFSDHTPVRGISGFMIFIAVVLGGMWVAMTLGFVFTGQVPAPVVASGHPTAIVFALDLTLVVPAMVLGAVWLWRHQAWGYVLGAVMLLKGVTYTLALIAMGVFYAAMNGTWDPLTFLWAVMFVGCLLATWFLLGRNMNAANARVHAKSKAKHPTPKRAASPGR